MVYKHFLWLIFVCVFTIFSCKNDVVPRPKSYLRLDYPVSDYKEYKNDCNYIFDVNTSTIVTEKQNCALSISYPKMKATIYITYYPVKKRLKELLIDAQKLTFEHVIKADDIIEQPFINPDKKVYGMFYEVTGNAATSTQFYATDSINHFVTGSIYFYVKPNFDSIMPAANYIQNDMRHLLETLKWKK